MSYEYRAQMMNSTIKDAKDNYENAKGNAEKEKYEIEIQRLQSLQNAYKIAGEYEAKAKAFDELQSQLKEGKPYDDGYMGWVSAQSYDSALRKVLELTKKLKDKYEDKLDDGW